MESVEADVGKLDWVDTLSDYYTADRGPGVDRVGVESYGWIEAEIMWLGVEIRDVCPVRVSFSWQSEYRILWFLGWS